jgi:hypothetical protein
MTVAAIPSGIPMPDPACLATMSTLQITTEDAAAYERAMRIIIPSEKKRSELRAVLPVVAVLTVAMLAKLGMVSFLFHLAY